MNLEALTDAEFLRTFPLLVEKYDSMSNQDKVKLIDRTIQVLKRIRSELWVVAS